MCDYPEFYRIEDPVARKRHHCTECRQDIEPGVKYVRMTGKWDGDFGSYATCISCWEFMERCHRDGLYENDCGGMSLGGDFYDYLSSYAEDVLQAIPEEIPSFWLEKLKYWAESYRSRYGKSV